MSWLRTRTQERQEEGSKRRLLSTKLSTSLTPSSVKGFQNATHDTTPHTLPSTIWISMYVRTVHTFPYPPSSEIALNDARTRLFAFRCNRESAYSRDFLISYLPLSFFTFSITLHCIVESRPPSKQRITHASGASADVYLGRLPWGVLYSYRTVYIANIGICNCAFLEQARKQASKSRL